VEALNQAIALDPNHATAHARLAIVYGMLGRWEEATEATLRSLAISPRQPEMYRLLGELYWRQAKPAKAADARRRALGYDPKNAQDHFRRAQALLSCGDYRNGFREREWRLCQSELLSAAKPRAPLWISQEVAGRSVLLWRDGGRGDAIQMARYAPLLAARGARVTLAVHQNLVRLMYSMRGVTAAVAAMGPLLQADLWCPMESLPLRFGTRLDTIPTDFPYLAADPADASRWQQRLGGETLLKVGFVWGASMRTGDWRTLNLADCWGLLGLRSVKWFSLQVGERAPELAQLPGGTITDLSPDLRDFAETAAVIANLDLVITVDTAVAHLALALGRPTWVMLPFEADWRWGPPKSERSPWYPAARLFWQPKSDDWAGVIRDVAKALIDLTIGELMRPGRTAPCAPAARKLHREFANIGA
jgi:Glycosyltransferase family 9 (heptosyltransferase)/Tetratricopeptide repeat